MGPSRAFCCFVTAFLFLCFRWSNGDPVPVSASCSGPGTHSLAFYPESSDPLYPWAQSYSPHGFGAGTPFYGQLVTGVTQVQSFSFWLEVQSGTSAIAAIAQVFETPSLPVLQSANITSGLSFVNGSTFSEVKAVFSSPASLLASKAYYLVFYVSSNGDDSGKIYRMAGNCSDTTGRWTFCNSNCNSSSSWATGACSIRMSVDYTCTSTGVTLHSWLSVIRFLFAI